MNKFFKLFLILAIGISFVSCTKTDSPEIVPARDFAEQYAADIDSIDEYIDSHYITVDADYNVTMTKIPTPNTENKVSIRLQNEYPIRFKMVNKDDVDYKVYYLKLREGVGQAPTAVDSVYISYKGNLLNNVEFDYSQNPVWFQLEAVIAGWSEIIPLFKTGTYDTTVGPNPVAFADFGAGVMFVPSGLAYFNGIPSALVPQYSPLIFNFKLNMLRYKDHDRDGIYSKDEVDPDVLNQDPSDYDSDGDGIANMYDVDDDGDRYLTKDEITKTTVNGITTIDYHICPATGKKKYLDATNCL